MFKHNRVLYVILVFVAITTFSGSVFITSEKFVNTTNIPKFYFVVLSLLVMIIFFAARAKKVYVTYDLILKTLIWGIFATCSLQALYGICQFFDFMKSNHSMFPITGSFDNPAGFASVLSISFPAGLFLLVKSTSYRKILIVVGLTLGLILKRGPFSTTLPAEFLLIRWSRVIIPWSTNKSKREVIAFLV